MATNLCGRMVTQVGTTEVGAQIGVQKKMTGGQRIGDTNWDQKKMTGGHRMWNNSRDNKWYRN